MTEACPNTCVDGRVECWAPGGPCPKPNDPRCELCGACAVCRPLAYDAEKTGAVSRDGVVLDSEGVRCHGCGILTDAPLMYCAACRGEGMHL